MCDARDDAMKTNAGILKINAKVNYNIYPSDLLLHEKNY